MSEEPEKVDEKTKELVVEMFIIQNDIYKLELLHHQCVEHGMQDKCREEKELADIALNHEKQFKITIDYEKYQKKMDEKLDKEIEKRMKQRHVH